MNVKNQEQLGRDHFYLTQALLASAEKQDIVPADLFGQGEDQFIQAIFGHSAVLHNVLYNNDIEVNDNYFKIIETLATFFWKVTKQMDKGDMECPLLSVDHFRIMVKSVINKPPAKLPLGGHFEKDNSASIH